MRSLVLLLFIHLAAAGQLIANVATGLLHADGIVTVQGADVAETSITVVPASGNSYELKKGTKEFKLELPLNDTYLVIFAHPKCLTKQLFFDTRVPEDYGLDHYTFPFEVVLEAQVTEDVSYVGPVGYIMYKDLVNDFDYETDYTLQIDEKLKERMEAVITAAAAPSIPEATEREPTDNSRPIDLAGAAGSADPAVPATPSATATIVGASNADRYQPRTEPSETRIEREPAPVAMNSIEIEPVKKVEAPIRPVEAEVADVPMSEPPAIEEPEETQIENGSISTPAEDHAAAVSNSEGSGPSPMNEPGREIAEASTNNERSDEFRLPTRSNRVGTEFKSGPDPMKFGRQEELIVEANKVTTIVRIVNELGYQHEYRRIAHKFGPVFYFKDDQSIPAHMYADDTGLPAN